MGKRSRSKARNDPSAEKGRTNDVLEREKLHAEVRHLKFSIWIPLVVAVISGPLLQYALFYDANTVELARTNAKLELENLAKTKEVAELEDRLINMQSSLTDVRREYETVLRDFEDKKTALVQVEEELGSAQNELGKYRKATEHAGEILRRVRTKIGTTQSILEEILPHIADAGLSSRLHVLLDEVQDAAMLVEARDCILYVDAIGIAYCQSAEQCDGCTLIVVAGEKEKIAMCTNCLGSLPRCIGRFRIPWDSEKPAILECENTDCPGECVEAARSRGFPDFCGCVS